MRKRIGVLSAQLDEHMQKKFITAFLDQAYQYDYEVCLFSMFQKFQETELRNIGDSNIYELINYDMFDALLLMPDTILVPGVNFKLMKRIQDGFKGPVLVVDLDNPFFPCVKIDHYTPMKKLIDHLIQVHGYEEIAFLGGKEGHPHSIQRLNAYYDSLREHKLLPNEELIYHGNYWYDSGKTFAQKMLARGKLPDALACANDCMAIGAASYLSDKGYKIPEDMALIGYDSSEEGRHSPLPLTSADIPSDECGAYCAKWLHHALIGEVPPVMELEAPLFLGGSCGCTDFKVETHLQFRREWKTAHSDQSFFSDFNHITEDLLTQNDFRDFYKSILDYSYQIRPFKSFHLCINDGFMDVTQMDFNHDSDLKHGYTPRMHRVIHCTEHADDVTNIVDFQDVFDTKDLLPDLFIEKKEPCCYVFNPMYFNDRCFGYTVISYDKTGFDYDETFRIWMKSIMQGMESFLRQLTLQKLISQIKADQIRDSLTGLYNYQGFLQKATPLFESGLKEETQVVLLALDIQDLKEINATYSREIGDRAILLLARIIRESVTEQEICCRMCNDEFLIILKGINADLRAEVLTDSISEKARNLSILDHKQLTMQVHSSSQTANVHRDTSLDYLINHAITKKNHQKSERKRRRLSVTNLTTEDMRRNDSVAKALDNNTLRYDLQPIINAKDASIFGYEALMRCDDPVKLSPPQLLEGAACLGRLYDIEKATFINVLSMMQTYHNALGNRKIFLNSLPAFQLTEEDSHAVETLLHTYYANLVVEITEESELNDEQLAELQKKYRRLNIQTALDDYGSGYSNINNLLRYMPRYVKIDRLLISDIDSNPQKQHFVKSIIDFAHDNDIVALAEGVETSEELQQVIRLDIDLIQGFYTAKPQPTPMVSIDDDKRIEILKYQLEKSDWKSFYKI